MLISTIFYVTLFAALQYILFSVYLFNLKKGNIFSNRIFAIFLITTAARVLCITFKLGEFAWTLYFTVGPLIFLYSISLIRKKFNLKRQYILHFLPYVIYSLIVFINFSDVVMWRSYRSPFFYLSVISIDIHVLIYLIVSLKMIKKYNVELEDNFSTIDKMDLKWLRNFILIFMIGWYIGTFRFWLSHFVEMDRFIINSNVLFSRLIALVLSIYVVFKGLKYPKIFTGIEEKPRYEKSNLDQSTKDRILGKLKVYMEDEKPYINHTLSLNELADRLNISTKNLSQVINECMGQNFYDFINSHRIEEAKISIKKFPYKTFLEILHEAGFNSKAVFNASFKKHTGMTPSEFKNSIKKYD